MDDKIVDQDRYPAELRPRTRRFLNHLEAQAPIFFGKVLKTAQAHPSLFGELSDITLRWADAFLGHAADETLINGYVGFVIDVNRGQAEYEVRGRYEFNSHAEASCRVYDNDEFMNDYHWGVYVTAFAWEHHLLLHDFFKKEFIGRLSRFERPVQLIDLGAGSGLWSLLTLAAIPSAKSVLVDVSPVSVALCRRFVASAGYASRAAVTEGDALQFRPERQADAGLCCFLMEHLERPQDLLANLAQGLQEGALAFVTVALTAAETDHIYEFKRESEPVSLAEENGLRVLASLSVDPGPSKPDVKYLPRSMAMVLQKRRGSLW